MICDKHGMTLLKYCEQCRIAELEDNAVIADANMEAMAIRNAELEAWHDLLSEAGLINYGETPEEGVKSIQALLQQGEG